MSPARSTQLRLAEEFSARLALPSGEFIGFVLNLNKVRRDEFLGCLA